MSTEATERCEWNPKYDVPAMEPPKDGDCPNVASMVVGKRESFHLCAGCAARSTFRKHAKRPLRRKDIEPCKS